MDKATEIGRTVKKKLLEDLSLFVANNPGDSGDLLRAIADGMAMYELAQKAKRDELASQGMMELMHLTTKFPKFMDIPLIIDALFYQFPKGVSGHSIAETDFWDLFIDLARRKPVDRKWLEGVKGYDFVVWWDTYVKPDLVNERS
jgi:hypothetical protein